MSLDWSLYRELFSPNDNPIWGRFPHPPLGQVSARLGVSTTSVWRKLTEWRRSGFLRGYLILPHPAILGVGLCGFCVKVSGPAEKQKLLEDLGLIDGIIFSADEIGPRVDVVAVADGEESQKRRKELISRLPGVSFVGATRKLWLPQCNGFLTARDWRIVLALRDSPEDSLTHLASRAGCSTKTVARHLDRLRQTHAVLSHFLEDWSHFPETIAGFQLEMMPGSDSSTIGLRFREKVPSSIQLPHQCCPPGKQVNLLGFLVPLEVGPAIDRIVGTALGIPGVEKVESFFPSSERGYAGWIEERLSLLSHRSKGQGGLARHPA